MVSPVSRRRSCGNLGQGIRNSDVVFDHALKDGRIIAEPRLDTNWCRVPSRGIFERADSPPEALRFLSMEIPKLAARLLRTHGQIARVSKKWLKAKWQRRLENRRINARTGRFLAASFSCVFFSRDRCYFSSCLACRMSFLALIP